MRRLNLYRMSWVRFVRNVQRDLCGVNVQDSLTRFGYTEAQVSVHEKVVWYSKGRVYADLKPGEQV
jgi:hypothetical protein